MPFTVRRDDRGFQKGDKIKFFKYDPTPHKSGEFYDQSYFKRESQYQKKRTATQEDGVYWTGTITYVLSGGQYGIEPGYVVLGLKPCDESKEMKNEKDSKYSFDVVLPLSSTIYAESNLDISAEVLSRLNKQLKTVKAIEK